MAVQYKGDVIFRQSKSTQWSVDSWGVDHAIRQFRGSRPLLEAFQDSLKKWDGMPGYSMMKLEGWDTDIITDSFPAVNLRYVGFKNGQVPEKHGEATKALATAQGSGTASINGSPVSVSGTFTYLASRTIWTWYMKTVPPKKCPISEILDSTDPLTQIVSYSMADVGTGNPQHNVPYAAFVSAFNSLTRGIFVSDYTYSEIFPSKVGTLWACRAEIDFKVL